MTDERFVRVRAADLQRVLNALPARGYMAQDQLPAVDACTRALSNDARVHDSIRLERAVGLYMLASAMGTLESAGAEFWRALDEPEGTARAPTIFGIPVKVVDDPRFKDQPPLVVGTYCPHARVRGQCAVCRAEGKE